MDLLDAYLPHVIGGVTYGLLLFTVASGLTLAFGVADVLNLAHGTVFMVGGYAAYLVTDGSWWGLVLAALAGTAAGAVFGGALSGAIMPLAGRGHMMQALLTFGVSMVVGNLLVQVFGSAELRPDLPDVLEQPVVFLGHNYPAYHLLFIGAAGLLAAAGWLVVTRSRVGALVRAMVDDQDMVAALGVNPKLVLAGVLAVAGALAGLAGALGAPILGPSLHAANTVLLQSLVIVVVGGLGSIGGAFVAALLVGQVHTLGVALAPEWSPYLLFAAMAVALLVRRPPQLLVGGRTT
ncbi:branched-chain amino acid transport system permease protein/branched-chain amino acid transport system permease protein [Stackebrandtia albiflava]|uniref:Branched-chain amino acid transport system permease protein/branched-chain amino acid transport system permease protein n=1 Tax=Stackebrandtia albiflava TaxID=406432 RepID=A0A562V3R3_9ACTN|nr:branched-chain amino acid ABC transporter permease [Stackebrandtia albiflava]TWJ12524.1 branched-chain amino acid transport system permease protein/branched-chain amino acid transport system permease protein [Stackebrandtia albiflava]